MEVAEITAIITQIGFPIAMCIILMRYIQTTQKELINKLGDISQAIAILCSKVERGGKEDENQ